MGNCYASDVVLFENFCEFFSVRQGVVKLGAADGHPFALHEGVMEVFDCHGGAVSGNQQLHVFIERRLHREKADFDGPLGLLGCGACGGGNFLGFAFEVFVYFLLVEGFCFPFRYRYGALRAVPQTGTKPVAVGFFDYLGFSVYDLEGALDAVGDAVAASVAEGFVYVHDFSFNHAFFLLGGIFRLWGRTFRRGARWILGWGRGFRG